MSLRPELYSALEEYFGHVVLANESEEMLATVEHDALTGKKRLCVLQGGEYLRVNCPFCNDTRQRLWINHRWGLLDPETNDRHLWLAHCYNEECLRSPQRQRWLYSEVFSDFLHESRDVLLSGKPSTQGSTAPVTPVLPGDVRLITSIQHNHPAAIYLTERGYDLDILARTFRVGYCLEASRDYGLAQSRLIIPIYKDGTLVG